MALFLEMEAVPSKPGAQEKAARAADVINTLPVTRGLVQLKRSARPKRRSG